MREASYFSALFSPTPLVLFAVAAGCVLAFVALALFRLSMRLRERLSAALQRMFALEASLEIKEAEEARTRAEAASEAKSRLLATISHEIRTPLNGILGMTELLRATGLDLEQQSYVEAIRASGLALVALIEEILDFSKIEAGKFELAQAPFDLLGLVEGVVELLAPQAQGKGLEIASIVAPELPTRVVGDAARLRQVLINLVGNAVKYTVRGGVGLRVSSLDGWLEFAIIDTGPGIPATRREAIFEEFSTGEHTASPESGSTGLGLSISRRLAEQMGGSLSLKLSDATGSTFVLRLPLPAADDALPLAPPSLAGKRALIVAASRFEAPYLAERLAAAGVELLWASSDEASRFILRDAGRLGRAPDFMIVDCALGSAAARALGEAARAAGVARSFVFFSPYERRAFGQETLQAFAGWLIKPLRARSLYARLSEPVNHPQARLEPAPHQPDKPLHGLNILLAEDNDINALIIERHVAQRGADITRVADGIAALDAALAALRGETARFDAILLDIRMPGLDGIEVARRLRQAEQATGALPCRLIALSADAFSAAIDAARGAGIDAFLTKPVDFVQLRSALAACKAPGALEERQRRQPA